MIPYDIFNKMNSKISSMVEKIGYVWVFSMVTEFSYKIDIYFLQ